MTISREIHYPEIEQKRAKCEFMFWLALFPNEEFGNLV